VGRDPSLLFVAAMPAEPDPVRVEGCAEAVLAQLRQQRLSRRLAPRRRRWLAAAAAVVVAVVGGTSWRLMRQDEETTPAGVGVQAVENVDRESVQPPPRVEVDMTGEGVRVYQFAQEEDDNTAVFFVVNPALES